MKKVVRFLVDKPAVFNTLRCIIEANYVSLKRVIKKEFSLDRENEKLSAEEKILDIPCGTGEFCMLFPPNNYLGLDISEKYIKHAQKKYKHTFISGDALKTGFDDNYFDKILMLGFLHHLDESMVKSILKEAKRILKPDGVLLLIEDTPVSAAWNIIGKVLQRYDVGSNIRPASTYKSALEEDFGIRQLYNVKSGFWEYSVFVLSSKETGHFPFII
jgi:ubiquinone/menaquinone biosynthesis C-methylase UbiE